MRTQVILNFILYNLVFGFDNTQKIPWYIIFPKEKSRLSNLFHLELLSSINFEKSINNENIWITTTNIPSTSLSSIRSVLKVLATGNGPSELLCNIKDLKLKCGNGWIIDHECSSPLGGIDNYNFRKLSFTSKTLACFISQLISGAPSLNPLHANITYCVYETMHTLYFGELNRSIKIQSDETDKFWARRPYEFSAASSIDMSTAIINILRSRLHRKNNKNQDTLVLYDPCCGSGTNLFVANRLGMQAMGSEISQLSLTGAAKNLRYASIDVAVQEENFENEILQTSSSKDVLNCNDVHHHLIPLFLQDATRLADIAHDPTVPAFSLAALLPSVDCVVANLPWGENISEEYYGGNGRILQSLGAVLRSGCECAFVTRDPIERTVLEAAGLTPWKEIEIGKPSSKDWKAGMDRSEKFARDGRCIVTFVTCALAKKGKAIVLELPRIVMSFVVRFERELGP
eukprot:gene474-885_t